MVCILEIEMIYITFLGLSADTLTPGGKFGTENRIIIPAGRVENSLSFPEALRLFSSLLRCRLSSENAWN